MSEYPINDSYTTIDYLKKLVAKFRDDRNWKKYHNPKDLAISISIESNELLELFQWKSLEEIRELLKNKNYFERIKNELADVIIYCLSFADILGIDVSQAVIEKIKLNEAKYPVEKFKGNYYKPNNESS
jgi:NTP pyrophosphatase (non-canonical NTP hydrolase)